MVGLQLQLHGILSAALSDRSNIRFVLHRPSTLCIYLHKLNGKDRSKNDNVLKQMFWLRLFHASHPSL